MNSPARQEDVGGAIRRAIEHEILSRVDEFHESRGGCLRTLAGRFGERGLLGLGVAGRRRGATASSLAFVFAKEIGRLKCLTLSTMLAVQGFHALAPLARFGTPILRHAVLDPAVVGRVLVARELRCRRGRRRSLRVGTRGQACIVSGEDLSIPNADQAQWLCIGMDADGGLIVVPSSDSGVRITVLTLPGGRRDWRVSLDRVRVPAGYRVHASAASEAAALFRFERMFAAHFYLSRCEEVIAVAADCLRARRVPASQAARAAIGSLRVAELHGRAAAVRALVERTSDSFATGPMLPLAVARCQVAELAMAVKRACAFWWSNRSESRNHPMYQLCDDTVEAPLDGAQAADLMGEVLGGLDCRSRIAEPVAAGIAPAVARPAR